jgi:hypothetical protein
LDSRWKVSICSLLSLLGRMWPMYESVVTRTLLFHTYYSCAGSVFGSCSHNHIIYLVCSHGNQHICFNPTHGPWEQWLEIRSVRNPGTLSAAPRRLVQINQCPCSLMHAHP